MVDLPKGTKRNNHDHTNPQNHHHVEELQDTYGVVCGEGLVVVDIDPYRSSYEGLPEGLNRLPPTLTVQTPHGGEHRYYATDAAGTRFPGIDAQGPGQYVVGPGSTLNRCAKKDHDCSILGEGRYRVLHDRPIAGIDPHTAKQLFEQGAEEDETNIVPPQVPAVKDQTTLGLAIAGLDTEYPALSVYLRMKQSENWVRTQNLIQGRYSSAGYPNDRSRAEIALIEELGWWYEDDAEIVWTIMDWICQLNPQTDTGEPRKWLTRGDSWRKTLFPSWFGNRETYDPHQIRRSRDSRPTVSKPTKKFVVEAVHELGEARTKDIVGHPQVDRGRRQIQRACKELQEEGIIEWHRKGRYTYYALREPS